MSVPFVVTIDTPQIEYSLVAPLLIVLGAATLGATRLIDNVDVIKKDGED